MHVITTQEFKTGKKLYIYSERIMWFKDNNDDRVTCCEVHLNNGEVIKTKELAAGIYDKMTAIRT